MSRNYARDSCHKATALPDKWKRELTNQIHCKKRLLCTCMYNAWVIYECPARVHYEEMDPYPCGATLCIFACLIIGGMMAFRVFKTWKKDFTRPQIDRAGNILWKPHKEAAENNCYETCCKTVSHITATIILQKLWLFSVSFPFSAILVAES